MLYKNITINIFNFRIPKNFFEKKIILLLKKKKKNI